MSIKLDKYTPLMMYLSPASIPQIVAHIQDYLVKHPILSVETIAEIIVQSLQEHPELINGEAIPISADSEQSIKAYIDALPALDTYTKAEIQTLLLGKQDTLTFDQAPTPGSSNPVTSSGIIAAMSALQSALETQINNKADRASTYTKTQVDTLLEDKADADDVYSKNTMDAKLLEVNTDIDKRIDDLGPYNGLDSDSTTAALSAAQGKVLQTNKADKTSVFSDLSLVDNAILAEGVSIILGGIRIDTSKNIIYIQGNIRLASAVNYDVVLFTLRDNIPAYSGILVAYASNVTAPADSGSVYINNRSIRAGSQLKAGLNYLFSIIYSF